MRDVTGTRLLRSTKPPSLNGRGGGVNSGSRGSADLEALGAEVGSLRDLAMGLARAKGGDKANPGGEVAPPESPTGDPAKDDFDLFWSRFLMEMEIARGMVDLPFFEYTLAGSTNLSAYSPLFLQMIGGPSPYMMSFYLGDVTEETPDGAVRRLAVGPWFWGRFNKYITTVLNGVYKATDQKWKIRKV